MEIIRARRYGQKNVYVHNDLSNAAFHFKCVIKEKLENDNRKGIAFDCMACLVMLAFTFEAKVNFLGHKLVDDWQERQPFDSKVETVFKHIELEPDFAKRPYNSIHTIKKFRDSIAHGKPVEIIYDETVELSADELDRQTALSGEWEAFCTTENAFQIHDDIDAIWKEMLDKSGLTLFETLTHGERHITFIEKVVAK